MANRMEIPCNPGLERVGGFQKCIVGESVVKK